MGYFDLMELSARAIQEKRFHDSWRGYNQAEVDEFLDLVAESFDRAQRELQSLGERIRMLDLEIQERRESEEMLKRTLMTAQRAAEDAISRAKAKAQELMAEADARAKKAEAEARDRSKEMEGRIDGLRQFERDAKTRLRTFFQQQLKALDALTEVRPPRLTGGGQRPPASSERAATPRERDARMSRGEGAPDSTGATFRPR
ncbi:MAG: DivIVA domain-containing protein [Actinobacteria bacterium]|nr:DivIVA domain-containing protein [Actinomycetota bacterium]